MPAIGMISGWRAWLAGVAAVAAVGLARPAAAQQGTVLRWKWSPDQVLRYNLNQEMKQTKSGFEEQEVSWTVQYVIRQEVKSVSDDGVATIEQTYESGTVAAEEHPGEKVRYDSTREADKDKAGHRLIAPYAAFIGKTITFDIGPEGEVPRLTGASAIIDGALAKLQTDPMTAMLLSQFRESLGDEGMRRDLELALRVVPDRPCRPGDHWEVAFDQEMPVVGTLHNAVTYKLKKIAGKTGARMASIDATGKMSQGSGGGEGGAGAGGLGALIDVKLKSSRIDGSIMFDVDDGRITRSDMSVDSEWEFGLKGGGDEEGDPLPGEMGGMKGTQKLEQRARLELIR